MRFAGEFAAFGTAVCWSAGSNFFAAAGRRLGSVVLNRLRITVACVFLATALLATRGAPWPLWASGEQVALLAVSGWIGFVFGDTWYFRSLVILGPGRAALLASFAPLFTALIAWPALGERLGPLAWLGMALTLGGVAWVMTGRHDAPAHPEGSVATGIAAGVLGALGQAGGYVLSKTALRTGIDPLSATVVRIVSAAAAIWLLAVLERDVRRTVEGLADRRGAAFMVAGAFCGPFLGVTLSLAALRYIEAGVAASITAFYPILTMLIAARFHGERLTWRVLAGALVAVAGVVVLFLR
uniref:DMT family transporter n=1 Tax=Eiseniibacteriota bacterium TaxID=2212470 RepID=A0A832I0B0_UNCEI